VTLSDEEAEVIVREHGDCLIYRTRWGEWRTRVRRGRCVFLTDNRCTIHGRSYYPAVCRGFPWTDAETGGPYQYDQTICPEFVDRPELAQIHNSVNSKK
jgi:Fe-S-cluster containining protein